MSHVWHPVIELTADDPTVAAEDLAKDCDDETRVVSEQDGDATYIERKFADDYGGWEEIGAEANPNEDYADSMIETVDSFGRDDHRFVFDYTNERFVLEKWTEPA